jgi:hypothetical protein
MVVYGCEFVKPHLENTWLLVWTCHVILVNYLLAKSVLTVAGRLWTPRFMHVVKINTENGIVLHYNFLIDM